MNPATLNELKTAWLAAKTAERKANEERISIEAAMLALLPSKLEGTVTDKDTGIAATFKVTRKVDSEGLRMQWNNLTENAQKAFVWKADISTRQLNALAEFDEAAYAYITQFITSTPAKPSISIKEST